MRKRREDVDLPFSFEEKSHEALVSVWWTGMLLRKTAQDFFRGAGTSEAQFNLLVVLRDAGGPLTQKELSEMLLVDKSNVTGLLRRMKKQDLVRRERVAGDGRSRHVSLTAAGNRLLERVEPKYKKRVGGVMSAFGRGEERILVRLTRKLRAALAGKGA
ncbi:MAG: MarR family winged helix-turn-helix transcriptional regulator [Planctomycetota bacterium]|jgi:DNA-binding MarR family transcriptional regulator